jgi:hypothetical protein
MDSSGKITEVLLPVAGESEQSQGPTTNLERIHTNRVDQFRQRIGSAQKQFPAIGARVGGEHERRFLPVGIQQDQKGMTDDGFTRLVSFINPTSFQKDPDTVYRMSHPVLLRHFTTVGTEKNNIASIRSVRQLAGKKLLTSQDGVLTSNFRTP